MDTTIEKPTNRIEQAFNRLQAEADTIIDKSVLSTTRGSWPFTLDVIQQTLTAYSDEERWALISAFRWCVDPEHPIRLAEFAAKVGCSDNTLYKIYRAKYVYQPEVIKRDDKGKVISRTPHPKAGQLCPLPDGLIAAVNNFLMMEKKRLAMGKNDLVQTPTLKSIVDFCDQIRECQQMGFLVGSSHIGKTWALEKDYAVNHNHGRTAYVRMPAAAGLRDVLVVICDALNVSAHGDIPELKRRIKKALKKDMLLLLDECHLLAHTSRPKQFFKIMEVIREFHDATKAGIVLCFTRLDDVSAAKKKELEQIWKRAPRKLILPAMPTVEDLTAIFEHNGLKFPAKDLIVTLVYDTGSGSGRDVIKESPRELVRQLAKDEALLAITERIRVAKLKAKADRKAVNWNHFVEAHLDIAALAQPEPEWN